MQLTSRGWSLVGGIGALYVAGRLLGTVELAMVAAGALAALAAAALLVVVRRPAVRLTRHFHPVRLHAGTPARADLEIRSSGRRRTPLLTVTDAFAGRREARFVVPPLGPGEAAEAAYRLPTSRRGVFALGPLTEAVTDAQGLVRRTVWRGPVESLTVYPRVEPISALPLAAGRDLVGGAVAGYVRSRAGEEFHGLREYEVGDDLRRVHWRSTAHTGQLMIREDDVPWQARAAVLLDTRRSTYDDESFERAVEATASIVTALHRRRALARLLTTGGLDSGYGSGHEHYETVMERLAAVEPVGADRLDAVAGMLHRQAGSGALVAVVGVLPAEDLRRIATLARRFGIVVIARMRPGLPVTVPGARLVEAGEVDRAGGFGTVWNEAMARWRAPFSRR